MAFEYRRGILLWAVLGLTGCSGDDSNAKRPDAVSMAASDWHIQFSPDMPSSPSPRKEGWAFSFPSETEACPGATCPSVHYVVTRSPLLRAGQTLIMNGQIVASENASFNHVIEGSDNNIAGGGPSACRFYFQRAGDNFSARGKYEYFRWWARTDTGAVVLKSGVFSANVILNPENWLDVWGHVGNEAPATQAGFASALADIGNVGFTCGGGYSYGHGVNMKKGKAELVVRTFNAI